MVRSANSLRKGLLALRWGMDRLFRDCILDRTVDGSLIVMGNGEESLLRKGLLALRWGMTGACAAMEEISSTLAFRRGILGISPDRMAAASI